MKRYLIPAAALFVLIASAFACANQSSAKNNVNNKIAGNGFAVIELFTSEGCSSCPPADATVAKLLKEYNSNVYVLGYHVDYWDNLGWKDAFSNAAYTERQKNYAKVLNLSTIYTPQVVVNGNKEFVGSNDAQLHSTIDKDLKEEQSGTLSIAAKANNKNSIEVSYETNADNNLNIALIQLSATNKIQRGENNGAILHHVNIVRNLQTITLKNRTGKIFIAMPSGLSAKDCEVIAFIQDAKNMKITAATKADIQL